MSVYVLLTVLVGWWVQRLQGKGVTFITGTDEHGEKIALAAANRGLAPKEHCDDIVASYKGLWKDVRNP